MISDGDSSAYETIKRTYIDLPSKKVDSFGTTTDHRRDDFANGDADDSSKVDVSNTSLEKNNHMLVRKEDCINHVKKRVLSHLGAIKTRSSGLEDVLETDSPSAQPETASSQVRESFP